MKKVNISVWTLHTAFSEQTKSLLAKKALRSSKYDIEKEFDDVDIEWLKNASYERSELVRYTTLRKSLN